MAASSSQSARTTSPAERFQLVRELSARAVPVWAAVESSPNGRNRLVVVQRVLRATSTDEEIATWTGSARRLATLEHPNIARTREVVARSDDVLVVGDYVDGVRWSELASSASPPPLELALRVIVDLLTGLSALHNLRDEKRQPLKLVHGELTPECVLVGLDGVARLVDVQRVRSGASGATEAAPYLAPEVLLAGDTADARADIFSVGVLLWEVLSGRSLFRGSTASAIVTQVLGGQIPRATPAAAYAWATPLVDAAAKALSAEPDGRFGSAATFAAELRRVAGAKIAPSTRIAALIRTVHGERIRARRQALEQQGNVSPVPASATPALPKPPSPTPPSPAEAAQPTQSASPAAQPTRSASPVPPPLPPAIARQASVPDRALRIPPPLPLPGARSIPAPDPKLPPPGAGLPVGSQVRPLPPPLKLPPPPIGAVNAQPESAGSPPESKGSELESGSGLRSGSKSGSPHDAAMATATAGAATKGRSRRGLVVGIVVVASLGAASVAIAGRFAPTHRKDAAPPSVETAPSGPASVQSEPPPPLEPQPHAEPTAQAPPEPSPSSQPSEPPPSQPAEEVPAQVAVAPVAASVATQAAAQIPAPPTVATPASPHPVSKHKYDPEGI